jgi:hypothetical protein
MIDFLARLPGRIVDFGLTHPFLTFVVVATVASVGYVVILKAAMALEDLRDTRNRKL